MIIMKLKEFFRLDISKVAMIVIFLSLSLLFIQEYPKPGDPIIPDAGYYLRGWPFPLYGGYITVAGVSGPGIVWGGLILDLFLSYLVSCVMVYFYQKIKKSLKKTHL